jgi:hypothetical protein
MTSPISLYNSLCLPLVALCLLLLPEKTGLIVAQGKPEKHKAAMAALKDYNKAVKEEVLLHVAYE